MFKIGPSFRHFLPFLATVGHNTVSSLNTAGVLSVELSVARNTLRSPARRLF